MTDYNYSNNGVDYDPDLLYGGQRAPEPQRSPRRHPSRDVRRTSSQPEDMRSQRIDDEDFPQAQARPRQRRRQADDESMRTREAILRRDRENERRIERARRQEEAENARRAQIAAEKEAEKRVRDAERAAAKARRRADREAARKVRSPFSESGFVKFFLDKRTHAFFGVLLICVAVYLLIAAISFMRSGTADQSAVSSYTVSQITTKGAPIENNAGPVGAMVAQMIFSQGLGLGSLVAIVYLVIIGLALMRIKKCNFWSVTFKSLLVAVAISVVVGFIALWCDSEFLYGGVHGYYLNSWLVANVDWVGAALVSLIMLAAVIYLYLNDIIVLYRRYKALQRARKEKAEQMRIEREEAQARVVAAMQQSKFAEQNEESEETESQESGDEHTPPQPLGFNDEESEITDAYAITPGREVSSDPSEESTSDSRYSPAGEGPRSLAPDLPYSLPDTPVTEVGSTTDEITSAPDSLSEDAADEVHSPDVESVKHEEDTHETGPIDGNKNTQAENTDSPQEPSFEVVSNEIEAADIHHIGADTLYDPTAELSMYKRPGLDLLNVVEKHTENVDIVEQEANKERIIKALRQFDIEIAKIEATVGPTVTLYEIVPAEGVRIAKIKRLEDDIALTLSARGIRIIAPMPGKGTIGIEVPNHEPQSVSIQSILASKAFQECDCELPMAMGATISNDVYIADLAQMPHLLVAGATGQGKSVGLNTIIASLLYKKHPAELKFVLIDPKRVEFSLYNALENHFLAMLPGDEEAIVTDMDKVVMTLNSLCVEMERRYDLMKEAHVVKITKYNELFIQKKLNPEKGHRFLPYIVIIVDEFADLIMTAGKQVETPIARIAQMARAVGMHIIIATQRPSTNVITGLIKANFPGRVAFRVSQSVDSKIILDRPGANQLIGRGDMLFSHNGVIERVQGAYIDTSEVRRICEFVGHQAGYMHPYFLPEPEQNEPDNHLSGGNSGERDPLYEEAARIIVQTGVASTSSLQRRFTIGYNRAGRIMDQLQEAGIVGPAVGGKARSVLVDSVQLGSILGSKSEFDD